MKSKDEIIARLREKRTDFIWFWFTDILGRLRGVSLSMQEAEKALEEGIGFDGSSIEGFARIHESDLMAVPDLATFAWLPPVRGDEGPRACRFFCDLYTPDGDPYEGDPRRVLRNQIEKLEAAGRTFYVGPEPEFFLFKDARSMELFDSTGYFDASLAGEAVALRRDVVRALESMGVPVEFAHHEVAPSQHEIDVRYDDALAMADTVMTLRFVTKEVASGHGALATFMPKPLKGINGSGMHCHQSIFEGERNLFFDGDDPYDLSAFGRSYIAGILEHVREITAVLNQHVNSYKRLVPGYEAPVYICWGRKNRSALVRVPRIRVGRESSVRIELRSPDAVTNPYLAFSLMLAAGMDGVERELDLPEPVEANLYELSVLEREQRGIHTLPESLYDALKLTRESELVRRTLGEHIFGKFLDNKIIEWDEYRQQVSAWERESFLDVL